jgi:hypothetical protein
MGNRFDAELHLKSPFDSKNLRIMGDYTEAQALSPEASDFLIQYRSAVEGKKSAVQFQ